MALTPGVVTVGQITSDTVQLSATEPLSGTAPFTYQWYRSTTTGFVPGVGNVIAGATDKDFVDKNLTPGTQYFYVLIATEDGPSPDEATYVEVSAFTLAPQQNQNQFSQTSYLGMVDLRFPYNTVSCLVDDTQQTPIYPGQAVKMVDSSGGVPKVVAVSSDSDEVLGFVNYDIKSVNYPAGVPLEISMSGNVVYLYATGAIGRGVQVVPDITTRGGVQAAAGKTGKCIVGWAFDKATAPGQLIRVFLGTPSFVVV